MLAVLASGGDIVAALQELGILLGATETDVLTFRKSIPALTADVEDRRLQVASVIRAVFLHYPPGPNYLVEARLIALQERAVTPIIPSREDSFVTLDDAFIPFLGLYIPIAEGTTLRTEWWNYDGGFAHTVPVTVVVSRR